MRDDEVGYGRNRGRCKDRRPIKQLPAGRDLSGAVPWGRSRTRKDLNQDAHTFFRGRTPETMASSPLSKIANSLGPSFSMLLLESARVAGDTQPFSVQINPSVRESPVVVEGLTLVKPFGMIDSSYHSRVIV